MSVSVICLSCSYECVSDLSLLQL
uniref:Uncharacterized protein n=1 Tax=Anguilla anguilla TaxID=7936 RepID=A0A0E9W2N7_ANGAN